MAPRERNQQPYAPCGKPLAAMLRMDVIPDVPGISLDVLARADAQIDSAQFFARSSVHHSEMVSGHAMHGMGREVEKLQSKVTIRQSESSERIGHAIKFSQTSKR